jgi:predicted DNA-binding protein
VPITSNQIVPLTKIWSANVEEQIETYTKEMSDKLKTFKKRKFWMDDVDISDARKDMKDAGKFIEKEKKLFDQKLSLCHTFEFPHIIKQANETLDEMKLDLVEVARVWDVQEQIDNFITESKDMLWAEMSIDDLDDGSKLQIKSIKALHKCVRWCKAYKKADKDAKDFFKYCTIDSIIRC